MLISGLAMCKCVQTKAVWVCLCVCVCVSCVCVCAWAFTHASSFFDRVVPNTRHTLQLTRLTPHLSPLHNSSIVRCTEQEGCKTLATNSFARQFPGNFLQTNLIQFCRALSAEQKSLKVQYETNSKLILQLFLNQQLRACRLSWPRWRGVCASPRL